MTSKKENPMSENKKTALITGASSGLGLEFAKFFAQDGHSLVLVARRVDRLESIAADLRIRFGIQVETLGADLEQAGISQKVFEFCKSKNLQIEFLVNNAGFGYVNEFLQEDIALDRGMMMLNVVTLVEMSKVFAEPMVKRKSGRILNIGSTAGFQPGPFMATYYASKAFVNSFSEALSHELRKSGVTVTLSCPGPTRTEFGARSGADKKPLFKMGASSAEDVAREAYQAMMKGERRVIHGMQNRIAAISAGMTPNFILLKIVEKLQGL